MLGFIRKLGPLRSVLLLAACITVIFQPPIGTEVSYVGWQMVRTLLLPALAPLIFMVLLLDALMSRVLMSDKDANEQARLTLASRTDLIVSIILLLFWGPFFYSLAA